MVYRATKESISFTEVTKETLLAKLRAERELAVKRFHKSVNDAKKYNVDVLRTALAEAQRGEMPECVRGRGCVTLHQIPQAPERCRYDEAIDRITADVRDVFVVSQDEWSRLFPCKIGE